MAHYNSTQGNVIAWFLLATALYTVANGQELAAEEPRLQPPGLESADPNGLVAWTRKVFANGQWNATPDIAWWRDHYYVSINKGSVHNGVDGPVVVLKSADLKAWELIYETSGAPGNGSAVDCKLLALPDRLLLYYIYMNRDVEPQKPGARSYAETRAVVTRDGTHWSKSQRVYQPGHNFWKPKVRDGVIYVASDYIAVGRTDYVTAAEERNPKLSRIDLLRSSDGLVWQKVSTILKDPPWTVTETAIAFRPDGELWAFTRQDFLSRSAPPYTEWRSGRAHISGGGIAGPELIALGDEMYLAGRFYAYLAKHGPPDSPQTNKFATSLLKYNESAARFQSVADLPLASYADMGYSGFVQTKQGVFLVYYSGHAYREANLGRGDYTTQTDIYLSKLNIGKVEGR
ncbi:MAG: hypothetical protein VX346_11785 [Planctomycetota bacterium]|nr:hypothetical protein [Planctomycetota bacterium]